MDVAADAGRVFECWTRFEDLPRVMRGVRQVRRIDEHRLLWEADIAGRQLVWEAEFVELVPGTQLVWRSTRGAENEGEVRVEAVAEGRTCLVVDVEVHPRGPLERLGAHLGLVERQVERDLARFRTYVEALSGQPPG